MVWQQAMDFIELVYQTTTKFPKEEIYGLTAQLRRSSVSVASNIAEGQGRNSKGEFLQFLGQAKGSLTEAETQVLIAKRLKYVDEETSDRILGQSDRVSKLLNGLIKSLKSSPGR